MSILKLTPSCKDYLWGGNRLRTDFGVQSDLNPLAEAWVLSCHPDGPSYLPDGTMLADYLAAHPEAAGTDCKKFEMFPVLTKFIDAKINISIQVLPSNEYALELEHQYGKTELWYVLEAEPGATRDYGFTHEISKEEFDDIRECYGRKCEELEQMIENQKKLVKQMFEGGVSATVQMEDSKKSLQIKELDRTLLALTVDKIYIYENKQIKIHIRYQDMIEKMKVIRRFYAEHRTECRKEVG